MDITFLQISTASCRTTNPPVSESRTLTVIKQLHPFGEPRFLFQVKERRNAAERQAEYPLTCAQFNEIAGLFERLQLKDLLLEKLNSPVQTPLPQPCGGSSRTVLSFTANGVTVTADDPPQETDALARHLQTLCTAFVSEDPSMRSAPDPSVPGMAPAPVPAAAPAPTQMQPDRGLAPDEWFCSTCGQKNNGAFCTECGKER